MVRKTGRKISSYAPRYNTDVTAKNIWLALLRDFRSSEGLNFCENAEEAFLKGIADYRDYKFPDLGIVPSGRFKRYKQLESLMKKYRFADDKFTDEELEQKTLEKFLIKQEFFCTPIPRSVTTHMVLQRARKIARDILGQYDPEYTVTASRFGKKSSIGCPLSLAYIDHKLTDVKAFSGSSDCSKWFFSEVVPNDPILSSLVGNILKQGQPSLEHDSLNLVMVPKSWKTYRPITPLTLLGLFYSYGVGEQVTERLRKNGLDISRLQERHRGWVKKFSMPKDASNNAWPATADLSSASDSLTSELLNAILPREWYNAMKKTFSHQLVFDGVQFYTASVLPMGNGLTFPTETLVFYALLKAIAELTKVRGLISVYGDDLIYPSELHAYVAAIFPKLHLVLNLDKTFVRAPFRESCGSDYYMGCDVRPSFLPDGGVSMQRTKYASWLYKVYNTLIRRWDPLEIRSTLLFLLKEIASCSQKIFRVPPSYPDTAGVKVSSPEVIPLDTQVLDWAPIDIVFANGSRHYNFSYYQVMPDKRVVKCIMPYYWLALQGLDDEPRDDNFWDQRPLLTEAPRQSLSWETQRRERIVWSSDGKKRNRIVQKHVLVTSPARKGEVIKVTSCRASKRGLNQTEPMSDWF